MSLHVPVPYPHQPMTTTSPPAHPAGSFRAAGTLSRPALIPHPWNRAQHHRCVMTTGGADSSPDSSESAGVRFCRKRALKAWFGPALRVTVFLEATAPPSASRAPRNSLQGDVSSQNCLLHHFDSPYPLSPEGVRKAGAKLRESRNLSERERRLEQMA